MEPPTIEKLTNIIGKLIKDKINSYEIDDTFNPFLSVITPLKYVKLNSFMISLSTFFGMSIWEQISKIIAEDNGFSNCGKKNLYISTTLSKDQITKIEEIVERLSKKDGQADYESETKEILASSEENGERKKKGAIVDFYAEKEGISYLFEIKTAKPNKDVFTASKRKLLEWRARLKGKTILTFLVFPYNPYYPNAYKHFAKGNYLVRGKEFLIGEEYWNLIGGPHTFIQLLEIFKNIGEKLNEIIEKKITYIMETSRTRQVNLDNYFKKETN